MPSLRPGTRRAKRARKDEGRNAEPQPIRRPSRRVRRRSMVATGAGVAVVGGIVVATLLIGGTSRPKATPVASEHLATVQRTDLVSVNTFSGTVGSKAGPAIINRLNGTLTSQPIEGTTIRRGGTLYSIDGEAVVLFYGALP